MFEYLDFLQTPNPTFNNMPICPFIAGDLQTGNIKFMVYNSEMDTSLIEMIQEWEKLNEGKLQTQFGIPTREQRKVMTILRKAKYKEGRDYDFGAAR